MWADEVHVWRIDLDAGGGHRRPLVLSPDEVRRADRFVATRDRERFLAGRAAMRRILAGYLGGDPARLVIETNPFGKPRLAGGSTLQFNLSHTGDLALLAVADGRPVGIDVEAIRPLPDMAEIVGRFFAEGEKRAFETASGPLRGPLFFQIWTRKEACLKAIGTGLAGPLEALDVGAGATPVAFASQGSEWTVVDLESGPDHQSALAAEGAGWSVRFRDHS